MILLNYNFKMEFQSSKKLGHADGLSRLIPKFSEPLEDTVIAALKDEKELSYCYAIQFGSYLWHKKIFFFKAAEKDEFIKKWRNRYGWLKDRKKGQEYHLILSASKYYYMQIEW